MGKFKTNEGFTLIELLMVISIIGLISGVVLAALGDARSKARNSQRIQNIESIAKALQLSTTGKSNQLLWTSGNLVCLGIEPCGFIATPYSEDFDNFLKQSISGDKIPADPFFETGQFGYEYMYHSNSTQNGVTGAYIFWVMEGSSSQKCGRGSIWLVNTTAQTGNIQSYGCRLYLGPPTTSFTYDY